MTTHPAHGHHSTEMTFTARQARPGDTSETESCSLGPRDELFDWLLAQREHATEASVSAVLLELSITYEGEVLDAARVVLHRSLDRIAPPGDGAARRASDRPAVPGEFLG